MMYAAASQNQSKRAGQDASHQDLIRFFTGHLVDEEYEYFTKWDRLIDLEADASSSLIARTWLMESADRENDLSKCVSSLVFDAEASSPQSVFDETWFAGIVFQRSSASPIQTPLSNVGFEPGCRVVVGTDSTSIASTISSIENSPIRRMRPQMHILRGVVRKATETHLHIMASCDDLDRIERIAKSSSNGQVQFRMDMEDVPTGIATLRQNLVNLFTADKKAVDAPGSQVEQSRLSWLRDVLVRLRKPQFDRSLVKYMFTPGQRAPTQSVPGCDLMDLCFEFSTLNQDQQTAAEQVSEHNVAQRGDLFDVLTASEFLVLLKVISARDYALIQGLPGTGKTSTIAFVARLLAALGKRVLITSYTHAAVDNVLLKLIECGVTAKPNNNPCPALVRIGKKSSCHVGVQPYLAATIALQLETDLDEQQRQYTIPSAENLRKSLSNARIVGITALSIPRSPLLVGENFDVVIVDEAGQISQPAILGALMAADSFILVGDHMQLPPLVVSELAEKGGKINENDLF
jgi:DNA replication ATP-dependent helicase Dna2